MTTLRRYFLAAILFVTALLPNVASAGDTTARHHLLKDGRVLVFATPSAWVPLANPEGPPGTLGFELPAANQLMVLITAMPESPVRADANLRAMVEETAHQLLGSSVETSLPLQPLRGSTAAGYYVSATDRAPGPNEFKFVHQGGVLADRTLIMFTILYNPGMEAAAREALSVIAAVTFGS